MDSQCRRNGEDGCVQSVARTLAVLEELCRAGAPLRLVELSARVGLHKSTVYRLLATLQARGYVEQDPHSGRYGVGVRLLEVGGAALDSTPLISASRPCLQSLVEQTGETVNLAVLQGSEVLFLEKLEPEYAPGAGAPAGRRRPAHCTAAGKVLLAHLQEQAALLVQGPLPRFTPNTITRPEDLRDHLARVAQLGYAVDEEEQMPGARCVAAPVWGHSGRVLAAISVSGCALRLSRERLAELVPLVQEAARHISARLGHRSA